MRRNLSQVLTLIAAPRAEQALPDVVARLAGRLSAKPDWLAPGRACDLVIRGDAREAETTAREAIANTPIDVLVQPLEGRRKRVFVADLEATIIENELLDELAEFAGLREHVAEITRRAMNGEIDFAAALTKRVALLQGLPETVLAEVAQRIRLMPGARALIATLRAHRVVTALVSGGFTIFAERAAAELGFDHVFANRLDVADGRIAGTVARPILGGESKRDAVLGLARECGVPIAATLAIGDGANDLPMLQAAGLGVAFHAKPAVAAAAHWRIEHADLIALLYAQGYREAELIVA
ncbi:MAG TPA: phosphoserine phosphatase SerB [Stellaceae bacterium]